MKVKDREEEEDAFLRVGFIYGVEVRTDRHISLLVPSR